MVNINIEVPTDLHKQLKLKAIHSGTTLKELIQEALEEGVER